jgi:pimeloyl-ACP methyl ester carboxylesterase
MPAVEEFHRVRRTATIDSLRARAQRFARRYRRAQPTLLLVPGSTGSQLARSVLPYQALDGTRQPEFHRVWLDLGVFRSDIHYLEITDDGRDAGDHPIIADGPLEFFFSPYDEMADYFNEDFNFAVFGYDWRRPVDEAAEFLELFLELLRTAVIEEHGPGSDPRPRLTIACHSLGGLVALCLLERLHERLRAEPQAIADWFHRIVTVGTPFYGTASALHCYYAGMPYFNEWYGADVVTRVIGSFPGGPVVHFLDTASYHEYLAAFAERGERPELDRYPSLETMDAGNCECDPYATRAVAGYPPWKRRAHLEGALALRRRIHQRLPEEFSSRLFHIRVPGYETCCEIQWRAGDDPRDRPSMPLPFAVTRVGMGDGVVPYWSARYCYTPKTQVWDINAQTDHAFLMEDRAVLAAIQCIATQGAVHPDAARGGTDRGQEPQKVDRARLQGVLSAVGQGTIGEVDPILKNRSLWRRFFGDIILG